MKPYVPLAVAGLVLANGACTVLFSTSGDSTADGDGGPGGVDAAPTEGDYFIAPDGDDNGPGTREQPYLTWGHALSVLGEGEILVAKDGVYDPDVNGLPVID